MKRTRINQNKEKKINEKKNKGNKKIEEKEG